MRHNLFRGGGGGGGGIGWVVVVVGGGGGDGGAAGGGVGDNNETITAVVDTVVDITIPSEDIVPSASKGWHIEI